MKKVLIICTEKTGKDNEHLLKIVIKTAARQNPDEIVVVQNHDKFVPISGVTTLFHKKTESYQLASCVNVALDYCENKYRNDFILISAGDDCIWHSNYLETMTLDLPYFTVRQPMISYLQWPLDNDFGSTFIPGSWLKEDVSTLTNAIQRLGELGDNLQLFGLISVIWNKELCGLRYDPKFDGNWGLEDTDFGLQLLKKGCSIVQQEGAFTWHVSTGWKAENHQGSHEERSNNTNREYFYKKWRN